MACGRLRRILAQEFAEQIFIAQPAIGKLTLHSHMREVLPDHRI